MVIRAALRLHSLGAASLLIDEAASDRFATMPFREFLPTLWHYQGNMTLYYFMMRGWVHMTANSCCVCPQCSLEC